MLYEVGERGGESGAEGPYPLGEDTTDGVARTPFHPRGRRTLLKEIYGNTLGLKASEQSRLRNTYRRRVSPHEIVSPELARHLTELSSETNRQVGVLVNRKGEIEYVVVGNAHKLELPDIGRARAGQVRLRGLRLVHTHLKSEPLTKDDLTDLALLRLDMVAAVGVTSERSARRAALRTPRPRERHR